MGDGARIRERSYAFALSIVQIHRQLIRRREFVLSRQLLRAGTSVGANVEEASVGQSRRDFIAKMSIARKEAHECNYWLRIIRDSRLAAHSETAPLIEESAALCRMLTSIVKSSQERS